MYTKHHTKSIVLGKHDAGEADRVYVLLTPDFGKVYARAHGVRHHKARNKGALQTLSKASVSLVRGKAGWRVTNASGIQSLYADHAHDTHKLSAIVRVLKLAHRMVAGEGNAHEVFSILESFTDALVNNISSDAIQSAETLAVLRMLSDLGYVKGGVTFEPFLSSHSDFSEELLAKVHENRKALVTVINHALEASQL